MVELIARTFFRLTGRGFNRGVMPECPFREDLVRIRACSLMGITDKSLSPRFLTLSGEEVDVLRSLRGVIVGGDSAPSKFEEGARVNLVIFRGVFGCGGYAISVNRAQMVDGVLRVDCTFEDPGDGVRMGATFTQPAAIIPLARLPRGKYRAVVSAKVVERSATGIKEKQAAREFGRVTFKIN